MIDCISNQMLQRIGDDVTEQLVQPQTRSSNLKFDILVRYLRSCAANSCSVLEYAVHRNHSKVDDLIFDRHERTSNLSCFSRECFLGLSIDTIRLCQINRSAGCLKQLVGRGDESVKLVKIETNSI